MSDSGKQTGSQKLQQIGDSCKKVASALSHATVLAAPCRKGKGLEAGVLLRHWLHSRKVCEHEMVIQSSGAALFSSGETSHNPWPTYLIGLLWRSKTMNLNKQHSVNCSIIWHICKGFIKICPPNYSNNDELRNRDKYMFLDSMNEFHTQLGSRFRHIIPNRDLEMLLCRPSPFLCFSWLMCKTMELGQRC